MANQQTSVNPAEWDKKYRREQPFMAFGSLLNLYAQVNQGKGDSVDVKFLEELFDLACKLVDKRFEETRLKTEKNESEEVDY